MIDNILKNHLLRCPECNSELDYNNDEIIECSNNLCDNQYPIINEVPTFIDSTPKSSRGFEYQWKKRLNGNFEIDTLYGKDEKEEYSQFFRHLKITSNDIENKNILDAGCGSARMLRLLSEKHKANFFGIDLSSSLYDAASIKSINLIRGDLLKLPFKDNYFDFIFSGGVLHHTGNPQGAFKNLVKSLKSKGKIYIWLYSIEQGIFGKVRLILPKIYKVPHSILYLVCWFLACPIYLGGLLLNKYHTFSEIKFKLFDHLSPQYRSVHSENEVLKWFEEDSLINIEVIISQKTGGVGILGEKI